MEKVEKDKAEGTYSVGGDPSLALPCFWVLCVSIDCAGTGVAVFKVGDLTSKKNRYKVDVSLRHTRTECRFFYNCACTAHTALWIDDDDACCAMIATDQRRGAAPHWRGRAHGTSQRGRCRGRHESIEEIQEAHAATDRLEDEVRENRSRGAFQCRSVAGVTN
jgi:hypothetical protein